MRYPSPVVVEHFTLPAVWGPYLVNGDASGLDTAERKQADLFLDVNQLSAPVGCEDDGFRWRNDASHMGTPANLGQSCSVFTFHISPED